MNLKCFPSLLLLFLGIYIFNLLLPFIANFRLNIMNGAVEFHKTEFRANKKYKASLAPFKIQKTLLEHGCGLEKTGDRIVVTICDTPPNNGVFKYEIILSSDSSITVDRVVVTDAWLNIDKTKVRAYQYYIEKHLATAIMDIVMPIDTLPFALKFSPSCGICPK